MLSLARIDSELKSYEMLYAAAFYDFQQKELRILAGKIAEGIDIKELLSAQSGDLWQYRRPLRLRLLEIMTRIRIFGQSQLAAELERQKA